MALCRPSEVPDFFIVVEEFVLPAIDGISVPETAIEARFCVDIVGAI